MYFTEIFGRRKKMKIVLISLLYTICLFGVDIALTSKPNETNETSIISKNEDSHIFGYNLFTGKFTNIKQYRYNPAYKINVGDSVSIKFWGAYNREIKVVVDNQGNIFIPKVGIVNVLGLEASKLNDTVKQAVKKMFKSNVEVYANVMNYQPVTVFVTGSVNKPGLYEGLSSDSILQFLDKAKGINLHDGSFRFISIKRGTEVLKHIDLYNFLIGGTLDTLQFKNGDVIYVDAIKHYIYVSGDVKREYRFELKQGKIDLQSFLNMVIPNKSATNVIVYHYENNRLITKKLNIKSHYTLYSGDRVEFLSDHNANQITLNLKGEVAQHHTLVFEKGTSLQKVLDTIEYSPIANKDAIQLCRKSIAKLQKTLIDSQLKDLESRIYTASSITTSGAAIKKEEAKLILDFINRAKKIEPKGMVILNSDTNLSTIILEDQDTIYIPKKSSIITIQGEVKIPSAQTYVHNYTFEDYIDAVGGFTQRADTEHILIIRQNGKVITYDYSEFFLKNLTIFRGDSILVLGKPNSENLQISKDITQIIYHIAVSTGVVMGLF